MYRTCQFVSHYYFVTLHMTRKPSDSLLKLEMECEELILRTSLTRKNHVAGRGRSQHLILLARQKV
jgi:hypothetical protein